MNTYGIKQSAVSITSRWGRGGRKINVFFLKKILVETCVLFFIRFFSEVNVMYIPQDPPLVLHMLTSWWPAVQPVTSPHASAEVSDSNGQSPAQKTNVTYGEIATFENNKVTMGEQYDPIQNFYTALLAEFLNTMLYSKNKIVPFSPHSSRLWTDSKTHVTTLPFNNYTFGHQI